MIGKVETVVETLPSHDRLRAKKLLYELKNEFDVKTLAELLQLLSRYGFKLRKREIDSLLLEMLERSPPSREAYTL